MKTNIAFFTMIFGLSLIAQANELTQDRLLTDFKSLDAIECDVEMREDGVLRFLATPMNKDSNHFYDLDLSLRKFEVVQMNETSWRVRKEIDLSDSPGRLFPRFLYGKQITELRFLERRDGQKSLSIHHTPSTLHVGSGINFTCVSADHVRIVKERSCPNCLSELKY